VLEFKASISTCAAELSGNLTQHNLIFPNLLAPEANKNGKVCSLESCKQYLSRCEDLITAELDRRNKMAVVQDHFLSLIQYNSCCSWDTHTHTHRASAPLPAVLTLALYCSSSRYIRLLVFIILCKLCPELKESFLKTPRPHQSRPRRVTSRLKILCVCVWPVGDVVKT